MEVLDSRDADAELITPQMVPPHLASCPFSEFSDGIYDQLNLFDVQVEVQTSYKSQNVAFTCAESRFNGHSIVGHPIDIEILYDNSIDNIFSGVSKAGKISSSIKVSTLIPSEQQNFQKVIPEEDLKKTSNHCVPVSLVFNRLKTALWC